MTFLPPGELRPTDREAEIARAMVAQFAVALAQEDSPVLGTATQTAMADWLAAILCGYRLELLAGRKILAW